MQITDEMTELAFKAFTDALNSYGPCGRCEGRGYHHGFGDEGFDPDWCEVCGGAGFAPGHDDKSAMKLALAAAFATPSSEQK